MIILGCDPSLKDFGWSVQDTSLPLEEQIIAMGRITTKSAQLEIARYQYHQDSIRQLFETYQPDYVGIEIPHHNGSQAAGLYPIWIYVAIECYDRRIPYMTVLPPQLKSYIREHLKLPSSRKLFKSDSQDTAQDIWKLKKRINHNIADALIVNHLAYRLRQLIDKEITEEELNSSEVKLLTRTKYYPRLKKTDYEGILYKEDTRYWELHKSKFDLMYENKEKGLYGVMTPVKEKKKSPPKKEKK